MEEQISRDREKNDREEIKGKSPIFKGEKRKQNCWGGGDKMEKRHEIDLDTKQEQQEIPWQAEQWRTN